MSSKPLLGTRSTRGSQCSSLPPDIAVLHTEDHAGPGILLRRSDRPSHGTVWFEVADAQLVADAWGLPVFAVATGKCVEIHDPWGNTVGFTDYSNTHTA